MVEEWSLPGWAVVAAAVAVLVLLALAVALGVAGARGRRRAERDLAAARAEAEELRTRVEAVEQRLLAADRAAPNAAAEEYVITRVGDLDADPSADGGVRAPAVPAPLFADLVLRESVVQVASLAAGVRRALAPETRNRIRFEVKREVRRSRKQRRADLRAARRHVPGSPA
ncbi:hypothetical protein [Nocardioides deserti]|uniref:DUF4446 family protein n=1 Tax=Nocardioides deserti TaxID=1588644 RepID=A0ABR6U612_9ACTN|nr:hypothetical protein [Nocardioides deserti]MBC2959867.1 hypothetical protein [Nocardioides deserti]GGO75606.1 hypothetical protein GCM10012276_26460 [Nocardioides deserti]